MKGSFGTKKRKKDQAWGFTAAPPPGSCKSLPATQKEGKKKETVVAIMAVLANSEGGGGVGGGASFDISKIRRLSTYSYSIF